MQCLNCVLISSVKIHANRKIKGWCTATMRNTRSRNTRSLDTRSLDTRSLDTRSLDTRFLDMRFLDMRSLDTKFLDMRSRDTRSRNTRSLDTRAKYKRWRRPSRQYFGSRSSYAGTALHVSRRNIISCFNQG